MIFVGYTMAIILLLMYCYLQHAALKNAELVYRNPAVVVQTRTVRVEGPVRIITRVVETQGRVERETVEERGPVTVVKDSLTASTPVFTPPQKSGSLLLGATASAQWGGRGKFGAVVGYSFWNRLDIMGGYVAERPTAIVVLRF